MQVDRHNFAQRLPGLLSDIETAEFVAIDFEMTGLCTAFRRCVGEQETYEWHAGQVAQFLPIQLGVCTARCSAAGIWQLRPYTIDIFPSGAACFCSAAQSLEFLRTNHFDFNKWIDDGVRYARRDATGEPSLRCAEIRAEIDHAAPEPGELPPTPLPIQKKEDKTFIERKLGEVAVWVASKGAHPLKIPERQRSRMQMLRQEVGREHPQLHSCTVRDPNNNGTALLLCGPLTEWAASRWGAIGALLGGRLTPGVATAKAG